MKATQEMTQVTIHTGNDRADWFINHIDVRLATKGIDLQLHMGDHITGNGDTSCSGWFDSEDKVLAVAVARPFEEWFSVLVHEFCHFEQWIEGCRPWKDSEMELPSGLTYEQLFWSWLEGEIDVSHGDRLSISYAASLIRDMEFDCDHRAAVKIEVYDLPIDLERHKLQAIAYAHFYTYVAKYRQWSPPGLPVYTDENVLSMVDINHWDKLPLQVPEQLVEAMGVRCNVY